MSHSIEIFPARPLVGASVRASIAAAANPTHEPLIITPLNVAGISPFSVPLLSSEGATHTFVFSIQLPGHYTAQVKETSVPFEVHPLENLSFFLDFGLSVFLILFFLGGLILWTKKRKKRA